MMRPWDLSLGLFCLDLYDNFIYIFWGGTEFYYEPRNNCCYWGSDECESERKKLRLLQVIIIIAFFLSDILYL